VPPNRPKKTLRAIQIPATGSNDERLPICRININTAPNTPLIAPDAPITGSTDSGKNRTWIAAATTPAER
jgi:hypothetical protein